MDRKLVAIFLFVLAVAAAMMGVFVFRTPGPRAYVTVTLRVAVSPKEQVNLVVAHASSARFKYEIGKKAGVKPVLAQKLSVKPVPDSALVEMRLGVQTKDQAYRYASAFLEILQAQCGHEAQLSLADQSVR